MGGTPTTGLTPPPDPNTAGAGASAAAVPDIPRSWKERIFGGQGSSVDSQGKTTWQDTPLSNQIEKEHSLRLSDARRNYQIAHTAAVELGMGDVDPQTGKPSGQMIDPQTGQPRAMTPTEREQKQSDYEGS